ncbi:uncharacterized protein LOC114282781 [Camellia sinensis]|uniref:uncharacterized protein LOC114282781 n=1 Tax=Camellia sinensis TaxID=4442 RepID=UPI0010365AF9|nr:uncharacterized protein LOC114282781 [Camellia sinensis]
MIPPLMMEALIERVHQHIRVEEDSTRAKAKFGSTVMPDKKTTAKVNTVEQPSKNGRGRRANREDPEKRRLRVRTAITTVFNKPIYQILSEIKNEPFVRRPAKLGVAQRGYDERSRCTFHDEKGHLTKNCTPLRQHLEELVVAGHLDQYIEGGTQPAPQDVKGPNGIPVDGLPQGVINVIHGIIEPELVCELKGMIKKVEHLKEVLSAQPAIKKGRIEATNVISFSDKDLARLHCPHNDTLVVTLRVKNFDIKRILIDQGSSCEIMYYETFKQLKLEDKDLAPATSPLVGFNSMPEWPVGKIILPVKAGTMTNQVEFWISTPPCRDSGRGSGKLAGSRSYQRSTLSQVDIQYCSSAKDEWKMVCLRRL